MKWEETEFENLYAVPSRNGLTRPARVRGTGHKMINMGELFAHDRIGDIDMELVPMSEKEMATMFVEPGDLLFARQSLVLSGAGKCSIVLSADTPTTFESHIIRVRLNQQMADPIFYYYYFRSPTCRIRSIVIQGVQAGIRGNDLRKLRVHVPGIADQRHIASILSPYDDLIENNRRRIHLLEEAARLLYREWFVHLRFPGHEHVRVVDGVPEGWERAILPDVIDVNPKTSIEKGREIWYVPMSALSETGMTADIGNFERRTKHTSVRFRRYDVLLARITPCLENGKTGFVYFLRDDELACGSTEFIVLRGKRVSPFFTYCLARSYPFRENAIKSMIGSSGRQRVQVSCFDEYDVPLPPKRLLDMFDDIVSKNFEQIQVLMSQNDNLAQARDLLLPRLMNGEIAV